MLQTTYPQRLRVVAGERLKCRQLGGDEGNATTTAELTATAIYSAERNTTLGKMASYFVKTLID